MDNYSRYCVRIFAVLGQCSSGLVAGEDLYRQMKLNVIHIKCFRSIRRGLFWKSAFCSTFWVDVCCSSVFLEFTLTSRLAIRSELVIFMCFVNICTF